MHRLEHERRTRGVRGRTNRSPVRKELRVLTRGRAAYTPFLLFVGVNGLLLLLAGIITLVVLLVLRLS